MSALLVGALLLTTSSAAPVADHPVYPRGLIFAIPANAFEASVNDGAGVGGLVGAVLGAIALPSILIVGLAQDQGFFTGGDLTALVVLGGTVVLYTAAAGASVGCVAGVAVGTVAGATAGILAPSPLAPAPSSTAKAPAKATAPPATPPPATSPPTHDDPDDLPPLLAPVDPDPAPDDGAIEL